jgi:hypothetical protein
MMKVLVSFIFAILLLGCATDQKTIQIPQEKCERPVWYEGDSWKFTGGSGQWEEKIIREGGNKFYIKQTPRKRSYGSLGIIPIKLFPLWVGKKYGGAKTLKTIDGVTLGGTYSFNVVEVMDVQVEVGKFRCYKIEFKLYPPWDSSDFGIGYYYYSPETKSIVKFVTQSSLLTYWENYELSSFDLKRKALTGGREPGGKGRPIGKP